MGEVRRQTGTDRRRAVSQETSGRATGACSGATGGLPPSRVWPRPCGRAARKAAGRRRSVEFAPCNSNPEASYTGANSPPQRPHNTAAAHWSTPQKNRSHGRAEETDLVTTFLAKNATRSRLPCASRTQTPACSRRHDDIPARAGRQTVTLKAGCDMIRYTSSHTTATLKSTSRPRSPKTTTNAPSRRTDGHGRCRPKPRVISVLQSRIYG